MLTYLSTARHHYVFMRYLRWQPSMRARTRHLHHDNLLDEPSFPAGTTIFSDLERLSPFQIAVAGMVRDQLADQLGPERTLNDPNRAMARLELLTTLRQAGINDAGVWTVDEALDDERVRYPVFVRSRHEHDGALSELVHDRRELEVAVQRASMRYRLRPSTLLVVEFTDVRDDDGLVRKYSVWKMGDRLFPYHLQISRDWEVRGSQVSGPAFEREKAGFLAGNPHVAQVREAFATTNLDYGRIDYGVRDGRIQVWEINTNGHIAGSIFRYKPRAHLRQRPIVRNATRALQALDPTGGRDEGTVALDLSSSAVDGALDRHGVRDRPFPPG